ncbi:BolA family protein [Teredinibacter turnerae]|uniref:BolA family protein n=1 Tax=Teredinibacter turnerae TaxID=2426 RepID=UPI0004202A06|nr:BolA/IbaG family iron-sulfur metabolism protein [Teredinibacter turnerae]
MEKQEIIDLVKVAMPDAAVEPEGADCSFTLNVVSQAFKGEKLLARQQKVLKIFTDQLQSGALHSLSVRAYTPEEWEKILANQKSVQIEM